LEAEALILLRQGSVIEKVGYRLPCGNLTWEVDVFSGENLGLVLAEIELRSERQYIQLPPWIGKEVTGRQQYYNGFLAQGTASLLLLVTSGFANAGRKAGLGRSGAPRTRTALSTYREWRRN
jgi:CYTH domain-containing protein